jgi:hypothetical protein
MGLLSKPPDESGNYKTAPHLYPPLSKGRSIQFSALFEINQGRRRVLRWNWLTPLTGRGNWLTVKG